MTQPVYSIRLRKRGQLTLPQAMRRSLAVEAGDMLILVQVDDVLFLSRREAAMPDLAPQFSAMMQEAGVSLEELLNGLDEERKLIGAERHS